MIVYVAWPTTNVYRSNQNYRRWNDLGYKVAVATDLPKESIRYMAASVPPLMMQKYDGYYQAMNALTRRLVQDMKADIVIAAGDGIHPHPGIRGHDLAFAFKNKFSNGFGVMQPCGAPWGPTAVAAGTFAWAQNTMHATRRSDQRCESPWLGRTLIMEAEGDGPYNPGYDQYFGDHELHDVAQRVGCLWMNTQIHQFSEHWAAGVRPISMYQVRNYERSYEKDYGLYRARRLKQFPAPSKHQTSTGGIILP